MGRGMPSEDDCQTVESGSEQGIDKAERDDRLGWVVGGGGKYLVSVATGDNMIALIKSRGWE